LNLQFLTPRKRRRRGKLHRLPGRLSPEIEFRRGGAVEEDGRAFLLKLCGVAVGYLLSNAER
jgi:hypothetical protein